MECRISAETTVSKLFRGRNGSMKQYFCGQYDKCQSDTQTLAVISAVHGGSRSVQLITDDGA